MSRRKSRLAEISRTKPVYKDLFQQKGEEKLNEITQKLSNQRKAILYGGLSIIVLIILIGGYLIRTRQIDAAAQAALGKAIQTAEAPVTEFSPPAGLDQKTFKTEKERAKAAIAEFEEIARKYGSPYLEKALYFIAVNKLYIDRAQAISELEDLSKRKDEVGILSKFALAQAKETEGKYDEAAAIYQELTNLPDPIISKETINFNLARIYEKQGKKAEAIDIYYNIVKTVNEAKDSEGKPLPQTQIARQSKERLKSLDPAKAEELKDPTSELAF
jgi:tetratricopeptide (TPR) repeat protein